MRVIQTRYSGCHFRSRLEARWAVYFNALGLAWEYEREGFEFEDLDERTLTPTVCSMTCLLRSKPLAVRGLNLGSGAEGRLRETRRWRRGRWEFHEDVERTGEQRLMLAILQDAARAVAGQSVHRYAVVPLPLDATGYKSRERRRAEEHAAALRVERDAWRWLLSDDETWVFSYRNVCAELGLDADTFRAELRGLVRRRSWCRIYRERRVKRAAA